jgi:hypothetical protein
MRGPAELEVGILESSKDEMMCKYDQKITK